MKFGRAIRGFGLAMLYYGVYIVWQIVLMFVTAFGVSFYVSVTSDMSFITQNAADMTKEAYLGFINSYAINAQEIYIDFISKYAIHITAIAALLTTITYFIIFKVRKKNLLREVGLTKLPIPDVITLIIFGGALNVFVSLVLSMIPFPTEWLESYADASSIIADTTSVIAILFTVVGAPIIEEIVFRGLCYTSLKQGIPMLAAMIISSWGFGMSHGSVLWVIYASILGFLLVFMREKYRSLTASLLIHFGFNLMGVLLNYIGEMSSTVYIILTVVSGLVSVGFITHVIRTSKYRIELVMPEMNSDADNTIR